MDFKTLSRLTKKANTEDANFANEWYMKTQGLRGHLYGEYIINPKEYLYWILKYKEDSIGTVKNNLNDIEKDVDFFLRYFIEKGQLDKKEEISLKAEIYVDIVFSNIRAEKKYDPIKYTFDIIKRLASNDDKLFLSCCACAFYKGIYNKKNLENLFNGLGKEELINLLSILDFTKLTNIDGFNNASDSTIYIEYIGYLLQQRLSEEEQYQLIKNRKDNIHNDLIVNWKDNWVLSYYLIDKWTNYEYRIDAASDLLVPNQERIFKSLYRINPDIVENYILNSPNYEGVSMTIEYLEWDLENDYTKKILDASTIVDLKQIAHLLPDYQLLDFFRDYGERFMYYEDSDIFSIAKRMPSEDLLEFFKLRLLENEEYIYELAKEMPSEDLLEFFKLGLLENEEYIYELAKEMPSEDLLEFFKLRLLENEEYIYELAKEMPSEDLLEFFKLGLLENEEYLCELAERLPHDEFLQFWNLGLIYDLELVIPIIKGIPDELLVMYIKETDDFDLKNLLLKNITDKGTYISQKLAQEENNRALLASMKSFQETATPTQLEEFWNVVSKIRPKDSINR